MYDQSLVKDILHQILLAIARVERRAAGIANPHDFISSFLSAEGRYHY